MKNHIDDTQETPLDKLMQNYELSFFGLIDDIKKRADAISENDIKEL